MDKHIANDPNNPINNYPTKQEEKEQKFKDLLSDTLHELCEKWCDDNPFDYLDDNTVEYLHEYTADQIEEELEDNGFFDVEMIYYSNAMQYLKEHDNSLHESMQIASEHGYNTQDLNSELLASLLASRNKREDFNEYVFPKIADLILLHDYKNA
jgi:hypothetical protein